MINNQNEFNEKYSKETLEIKIKDEDFDEEQLIIENYPSLERLYLRDIDNIGKITLKNLEQLKECTIWGCETKELIIKNCPQIKKLNIRSNFLTSLEFLTDLENLKELELDGNVQLIEILKPYRSENDKDGWITYQKDVQEIFEFIKQNNPQELVKKFWDLKKSREDLKKDVFFLLSKETQQKTTSKMIDTKELVLNLGEAFKNKEVKISYLECRIQELIVLSKQQKEKITDAFLRLFSEKELLQELIKTHLEFIKAKKQKQPVIKLKRQKEKVYNELEEKLNNNEEIMEKIETILTDCEDLISWEIELENSLNNKSLLIEEQKQKPTNNEEKVKIEKQEAIQQEQEQSFKRERRNSVVSEIAKLQGQLMAKQEEINYLREKSLTPTLKNQNESLISQLINYLREKQISTKEKEIIGKTDDFLKAKKTFLDARKETIEELQKCLNELEKSIGGKKRTMSDEIGNVISKTGEAVGAITFGIPRVIGEIIIASNNFSKVKLSKKHNKDFQISLGNEEDEMSQLNNAYNSLVNALKLKEKSSEAKLFNTKYKIFDIVIKDGVWENRSLTTEKMEKVIISLSENLEELELELKREERQFKEFRDELKKKQQFQTQIPPK